jgi:hypothetical protein
MYIYKSAPAKRIQFEPLKKKKIMKVSVHAVNFTVDKKLVDFVQKEWIN